MIGPLRAAFHRQMRRRARRLAERFAPHLATGATVLDVGSGTGHNAEALRIFGVRTCAEADVVDFHVVGDGPVVFDGTRLPFDDRAFDSCLLVFVLSYVDDPTALLRETGLFLIAYTALVGWLATRPSLPKTIVMVVVAGNAAWTLASIALLFSGAVAPNLLGEIAVVTQAIATGVFAELQYIGLRRSAGTAAA